MHDAGPDPVACHNCGAALHGRFCADCGQEALPLAPTLRDVARDAAHELADVDGRIFRSVWKLFSSPGFLTREQWEGRRVRWIAPIRLYLFFSVAYFALLSVTTTGVRVNVTNNGAPASASEEASWLQQRGFQNERELEQALGAALVTWMPRVMFVLVPLFAGLLSIVRRRSGRTYPQHLYFALHAHAAWFGARALVPLATLTSLEWLADAAGLITGLYGPVYVAVALRYAYGGRKRRAVGDAILVLGVYGAVVAAVTLVVMLPFVVWGR